MTPAPWSARCSGGCVETPWSGALASIADGKPRLLDFGVTDEQAWDVGLACGGKVQVFVEKGELMKAGGAQPCRTRAPIAPRALALTAAEQCRRDTGLSDKVEGARP